MKCKTCSHPQLQAINLALLNRTHTLEALSHNYGLSVSSLHRHKRHLVANLDRARDRLRDNQQLGQFLKLNAFLDKVERAVEVAGANDDVAQSIRGASTGARIIRQMNRMDVPLPLDTVYRLVSSPQWGCQASLLPTDPQIITDLHQAVADIAFIPCPEPEPETISETANCSSLETQNSELETQLSPLLARLPLTATPETTPKNNREKSAKLPKKLPLGTYNSSQIQIDSQYKEIFAKNPGAGRQSTRQGGEAQAPPTILASADSAAIGSASCQSSDLRDHASRDRQTAHGKLQPAVNPVENQNSTLDPDRPPGETCSDDWNIIYLRNPRRRRGIYY